MNIDILVGELFVLPVVRWYDIVGVVGTELFVFNLFLRLWELFFVYVLCWLVWYYKSPVKICVEEC